MNLLKDELRFVILETRKSKIYPKNWFTIIEYPPGYGVHKHRVSIVLE